LVAGGLRATGDPSPPASRPRAPATVVVRAGDTAWGLAARFAAPGADPRAYVDALLRLNGGADLVPGAHLRLPK
jgi:hypothetical protein